MTEHAQVVVGASHAGVSLALQLRKEGWQGPIQLVGAETQLPYHRPPLSKDLLSGAKNLDGILLRPEKVYEDNDIELVLGAVATKIDRTARSVELDCGRVLFYDKLALCTGARVRELPGDHQSDRILYLRTAEDARRIQRFATAGSRVVIVGGGYIGLEAAAVLQKLGLEVTVLEMADRVLERVTSETLSSYLTTLHAMHGVSIKTQSSVAGITGGEDETQPISVQCGDGQNYLADLILIGIGVLPETSLAKSAGLVTDNGIVVTETGMTSDPNIFAAGDCTSHPNRFGGGLTRLESVQNANDQARVVAGNILGKNAVYDVVPWFWSDQYDIKLQMAGINRHYDRTLIRGDSTSLENEGFCVFYLRDDKLIAADCVGRPKEFMVSKQLITKGITPELSSLTDEKVEPASWLK